MNVYSRSIVRLPADCAQSTPESHCRRPLRAAVAAAAIAVLAAACSSGDGSSDQPLTTVAAPGGAAGSAPTAEQLTAALLTRTDLPAGFEPTPTLADFGLPETGGPDLASTDPTVCAAVLAPVAAQVTDVSGSAEASFTGGNFLTVDQTIAGYAPDAVAAAFDKIQSNLSACPQYSGTDADGVPVDYRLSGGPTLTDVPDAADAVVTFRLSTASEGVTLVTDAVVAVVGNSILQISAGGLDPIGDDVLSAITATAIERAAAVPEA